jgi:hypothetical protein
MPKPEIPTQSEFELWYLRKVRKDIKYVNSILNAWIQAPNVLARMERNATK